MTETRLEELSKKRARIVADLKEQNINALEIIAGLYNDPSHFIYELLQNAEDAKAKKVKFKLFENKIEIEHKGHPFTFKDVESITAVNYSTKKDDLTAIGKFGIGFKSVFAVTKTPSISSGNYNFQINDYIVPNFNGQTVLDKDKTVISLPFNNNQNEWPVFDLIEDKLRNIGLTTLLFLPNIEEISWKSASGEGKYTKLKVDEKYPEAKRVLVESIGGDEESKEYLIFSKPFQTKDVCPANLKVEIAYRIGKNEDGETVIIGEENTKLVVFFPTERSTYLNFYIQGPYKTTPNRENIPLENEINKEIIELTAELVSESIPILKEMGLLNVDFLEILPIKDGYFSEPIYQRVYEKVKEVFKSGELLLPTNDGKFTASNDALLVRGKELADFLTSKDIKYLFGRTNWLDTKITYDRTRELRDYIVKELGIKEVDFEDFAESINEQFLEPKSDKWLVELYVRLMEQESLWRPSIKYKPEGILRKKPIIRLESGKHVPPYDENGSIRVYLPTKNKTEYLTVKEILVKNEDALKFLKELGLTKADTFAELKEFIIPRYKKENPDITTEQYLEDFKKAFEVYRTANEERKKQLIDIIRGIFFIKATCRVTKESKFLKPDDTFIPSTDLMIYYDGYNGAYFINEDLFQNADKDGVEGFLEDVGCRKNVFRWEKKGGLSSEQKAKLREGSYGFSYELDTIDYDLDGLDNFIKNVNRNNSKIFWNLLIGNLAEYDGWKKVDYFFGEYAWFYYNKHTKKFPSIFLEKLRKTEWLYDRNGNCKRPSDLSLAELDADYNIGEYSSVLSEVLEMRIDEIQQLEEKYNGKFISQEEYELYKQWKAENETESEVDDWKPEVAPDQVSNEIDDKKPEPFESPDLTGQGRNLPTIHAPGEGITDPSTPEKKEKKENEKDLKKIGNWGERHVLFKLRKKYEEMGETIIETNRGFKINSDGEFEVIWLNKMKDQGRGYDFAIIQNGEEKEYIEVKSKIDEEMQYIQITGTQWEFARKLFLAEEGEKYKLYIVNKSGTTDAKIKVLANPFKLWREGKIKAHPVNLQL